MAADPKNEAKSQDNNNNNENKDCAARQPAVFVNHGGGPMPYLQMLTNKPLAFGGGTVDQTTIIESCQEIGNLVKKYQPKGLLIVSAHWEENEPTILLNENSKLLYDYYGFPKESYNLNFYSKCDINKSKELSKILIKNGFKNVNFIQNRGWDHGVFIPLLCSNIDVTKEKDSELPPLMQLSLLSSLDPQTHVALGTTLNELRTKHGIMVIGSGMLFHNMQALRSVGGADKGTKESKSKVFVDWLDTTLNDKKKEGMTSVFKNMIDWSNEAKQKNNARYCHPREEHLLPLHVLFGSSFTPDEYKLIMKNEKELTENDKNQIGKIQENFNVDIKRSKSFESQIATFIFA